MSWVEKYFPWLFETDPPKPGPAVRSRDDIVKAIELKDENERQDLAEDKTTDAETLDVLADDKAVPVRKAVAANPNTPARTNRRLATDRDPGVRLTLARRLVRLLPELDIDQHAEIYALTAEALALLAEDQVTNIRVALSSALKDIAKTPPSLARKLAADAERAVAAPILRYSAALTDEDLIEIIEAQPHTWRLVNIARRRRVSDTVSGALIETGDEKAGQALLHNQRADLSDQTLAEIVRRAKSSDVIGQALKARNRLPRKVGRKLSKFFERSLAGFLMRQSDLEGGTLQSVIDATKRRVDWIEDRDTHPAESARERVYRLANEDQLTEETLQDAIAWTDISFVIEAIAYRGGIPPDSVRSVIENQSPRGIVAVCWKADLKMRTAFNIERMAKVPHTKLIHPRRGEHYPLSKDEILWQLDFFGAI